MYDKELVETPSTTSTLIGRSAFVENNVVIKKDGETTANLKQRITMSSSATHELEFVTELAEDGKDTKSATSILSVDKTADGAYLINLSNLSLFKDKDGKSITDVIPHSEGKSLLKLEESKSNISMSTRGEELLFEFTGTDGKAYKITTNTTGVSIEYDGEKFDFSTSNDTAIDVNMKPSTIEAFLDKENKIFATPTTLAQFPSYFIGLFGRQLKGNTQHVFGDYTITSLENANDITGQPYIFVSKEAKGPKTLNYFYVDGQLRKCTGNCLMQYDEIAGAKVPSLVIETATTSRPKKGELPKLNYYSIPIVTTEDNKISQNSVEGMSLLFNAFNPTISKEDGKEAYQLSGETDTKIKYSFYKKDERAYTKYDYRLKPKTFVVYEEDDDEGSSTTSVAEEVRTSETSSETPESTPAEASTPSPEKTKETVEEKEAEEKEKEKVVEPKKEEPVKWKKDYKKAAEHISWIGFMAGMLLIAGAMLTGFGVLAIIGTVMGLGGVTGVIYADKFVFEGYIKKAKQKISDYELEEFEANEFAENFALIESHLDKASQTSIEKENALVEMIEGNELLNTFARHYNDYGVGFEGMLEGDDQRINSLIGYEGLQRKTVMAESLRKITTSTTPTQRNLLINQFINQNFQNLPTEKEEEIRKMFEPENNRMLKDFTTAITKTVHAQEEEKKIFDEQKRSLATASDKKIFKTAQYKKFSAEHRQVFFDRYSSTIVRHFANREAPSQENLHKLVDNLPVEEKLKALETLSKASSTIENRIDNVEKMATKNREDLQKIKDCSHFIQALIKIQNDDFATLAKTEAEAMVYFKSITALYHTPNTKTAQKVNSLAENIVGMQDKFGARSKERKVITNALTIFDIDILEMKTAYANLLKVIEEENLYQEIIANYRNYTGIGAILPELSKLPSKEYTLDKIAKKLGKDNEKLTQAMRLYEQSRQNQTTQMGKKIGKLMDSLEDLNEEIGFDPKISSIELQHELKSVQSNSQLKDLDAEVLKKIALCRIRSKKIESAKTTDKISEDVKDLYAKVGEITEIATSRKLTTLAVDKAVKKATGIEDEIDAKTIKQQGQVFDATIKNYDNVIGLATHYAKSTEVQNIIDKFNEAGVDADAREKLKELFMETYGDKEFNPNLTFEQVVAQLKVDGKIDNETANEYIKREINSADKHTITNLTTMEDDLGMEFIKKIYNQKIDDIKNNVPEEDRYDSQIDILTKRFGLSEEEIKAEYLAGKTTIEALLSKFITPERQEEYEKLKNNIRENALSDKDKFKIWKAEATFAKIELQTNNFTSAWNNALEGNLEALEEIFGTKAEEYKDTIKMLKLDVKEIAEILEIEDKEDKISALQSIETSNKLSLRGEKVIKVEQEKLENKKVLLSLPTQKDRQLHKAKRNFKKFEGRTKEFNAKIEVLLSIEDISLREEAFKAFVNGDASFFEMNDIKCKDFEFGSEDKDLLEALGVEGKDLLKAKKRHAKIQKIHVSFTKILEEKKAKLKEAEKSVNEQPKESDDKLEKASISKTKDNISIIGKALRALFAKAEKEKPAETEREIEPEITAERETLTEIEEDDEKDK